MELDSSVDLSDHGGMNGHLVVSGEEISEVFTLSVTKEWVINHLIIKMHLNHQ